MKNLNTCRFCNTPLSKTFVDLGLSPIANDYVPFEKENEMEPFYPLHVFYCSSCFLVQLPEIRKENEIFTDNYAYFSSFSTSWLNHAKTYVEMMIKRFNINREKFVVEIASNDGYLLQYFKAKNVPVLGVEPTKNTASVAIQKGIETLTEFFGVDTAQKMIKNQRKADLIIGNNVLAHVPDLNDFVSGMKILLKDDGIITMEFPYLFELVNHNQFDTIYHEHYSYYSFSSVFKIFDFHGLTIFDVERLKTHGGSLRIFAKHKENVKLGVTKRALELLSHEENAGVKTDQFYEDFSEKVVKTKRRILKLLINLKNKGKTIVGYGAPAKGNTLLNYCGIGREFLDFTVDKSPAKQNHFLPGVRIPIYSPAKIKETKPDYVWILPWNLKDEIMSELSFIKDWGGKFITAIPSPKII